MDEGQLIAAVIGGTVGSALTALATVPGQVREHDRLIGEYDEDLAQWVADEVVRLKAELRKTTNEYAARPEGQGTQLYSGAHARALARVKEDFLQLYRDQERGAERRRADLRDREGGRHALWRLTTRRGALPELETPAKAEPVIDSWRADATVEGLEPAPVDDPTRRTLEQAVGELSGAELSRSPGATAG